MEGHGIFIEARNCLKAFKNKILDPKENNKYKVDKLNGWYVYSSKKIQP